MSRHARLPIVRWAKRLALRTWDEVLAPQERRPPGFRFDFDTKATPPRLVVTRADGATQKPPKVRVDVALIEGDVYRATRGRATRIRLLQDLGSIAESVVVVAPACVALVSPGLVLDGVRSLLGHFGPGLGDPGDRFVERRFVHVFSEERLYQEFFDAGLEPVERRGSTFFLRHRSTTVKAPNRRTAELVRVLGAVGGCDSLRRTRTPEQALEHARRAGLRCEQRSLLGRARLRWAIGWVDTALGAHCFRRVLLEASLDAGAAREPVVFGLDVTGDTPSGHVAFKNSEDRTFDVDFELFEPATESGAA